MRFIFSAAGTAILLGGIALTEIPPSRVSYDAQTYVAVSSIKEEEVLTEPVIEIKETTLLFGGDVMLSRGINNVMKKRDDYTYPFHQLKDLVSSADIAVVNLEGPISSHGKNVGSIYSFRADPKAIEGLTFAGIDIVSLANNHAGDYGPDALSETFEILEGEGIEVVGAGPDMTSARAPSFVNINGLKIAFLGATPLAPAWLMRASSTPAVAPFSEQWILDGIDDARKQGADIIVILPHWGNEYETSSLRSQKDMARNFIDSGATLVIGHHPHVVQEVERYKNGVIAYSLGNFVFDQNFSEDTHNGLLLKIFFKGKDISSVEEIPIQFSSSYQPYVATSTVK